MWPAHPNWLGDVLAERSSLVELAGGPPAGRGTPGSFGPDGIVLSDITLAPSTVQRVVGGADRDPLIVPRDMFGDWLEGDDAATDGLDALARGARGGQRGGGRPVLADTAAHRRPGVRSSDPGRTHLRGVPADAGPRRR